MTRSFFPFLLLLLFLACNSPTDFERGNVQDPKSPNFRIGDPLFIEVEIIHESEVIVRWVQRNGTIVNYRIQRCEKDGECVDAGITPGSSSVFRGGVYRNSFTDFTLLKNNIVYYYIVQSFYGETYSNPAHSEEITLDQ